MNKIAYKWIAALLVSYDCHIIIVMYSLLLFNYSCDIGFIAVILYKQPDEWVIDQYELFILRDSRFEIGTDIFILTEQTYYTRRMWRKK